MAERERANFPLVARRNLDLRRLKISYEKASTYSSLPFRPTGSSLPARSIANRRFPPFFLVLVDRRYSRGRKDGGKVCAQTLKWGKREPLSRNCRSLGVSKLFGRRHWRQRTTLKPGHPLTAPRSCRRQSHSPKASQEL